MASPRSRAISLAPADAFGLVALLSLGLVAVAWWTAGGPVGAARWSLVGAAAVVMAGGAAVHLSKRRQSGVLALEFAPRAQHYVQASAQAALLLYWGWYWAPVYDMAPLVVAQLLFAYACDLLLGWSRRDSYTVGFGPVPIVFSINLFLWFVEEWFFLQFALIAVGFGAKEFIRWTRDGRRVHIFNPSSFPLALASVALLFAGATELTRGPDIAVSQFFPPHAYLAVFLVALPGQVLFGVASMTLSAVVATYLFGLAYFALTGVYFFYDSYIPIAVFLGMHLLFTDPSTAPRSDAGRLIFGALYGLSTVALYGLLGGLGLPTFYDKLLQVPILNLSVRALDGLARPSWLAVGGSASRPGWWPRPRHAAYVGLWTAVFLPLSAVQGVGDRHPGQWVPFWQQACSAEKVGACDYLAGMLRRFCRSGSGWGCNEAAVLQAEHERAGLVRPWFDARGVVGLLADGCDLEFATACENLAARRSGTATLARSPPSANDWPIVLRGTKAPLRERAPEALLARACSQGWAGTCQGSR